MKAVAGSGRSCPLAASSQHGLCGGDRVKKHQPVSGIDSMTTRLFHTACIGLRTKTARAIVVVVAGTGKSPRAITRAEITLSTPATPELYQPYHQFMNLPWDAAVVAVRDAEQAIETAATRSLKALLGDLKSQDLEIASLAIVGAPERNLKAIGSPHIRAHAAEGVLFRHVWQVAAETVGLRSEAFSEKGFELFAAARLCLDVAALRARLAEFSQTVGRPWRADEKAASAAAWIALSSSGSPRSEETGR
jgi:hypothetical protein